MPDSILVYLGLALILAGLVSLIRPLRFLCVRTRLVAAMVTATGVFLEFIAGDMLEGPLPGADVISHRPSPKLEHHAGEPRRLRVDDNAVCGLASRCRLQSGDDPTPHRPYLDAVRI